MVPILCDFELLSKCLGYFCWCGLQLDGMVKFPVRTFNWSVVEGHI